jgi:hypothetical protein
MLKKNRKVYVKSVAKGKVHITCSRAAYKVAKIERQNMNPVGVKTMQHVSEERHGTEITVIFAAYDTCT